MVELNDILSDDDVVTGITKGDFSKEHWPNIKQFAQEFQTRNYRGSLVCMSVHQHFGQSFMFKHNLSNEKGYKFET